MSERYDALLDLFSQIMGYLDRLSVRLEAPAALRPEARTNVLDVLVLVLRVLGLATRLLKKNRFGKLYRRHLS